MIGAGEIRPFSVRVFGILKKKRKRWLRLPAVASNAGYWARNSKSSKTNIKGGTIMLSVTKKSDTAQNVIMFAVATLVLMLGMFISVNAPVAYASGVGENAKKAIQAVVTVIKLIGAIVGVILIVQGGMKYAMAHSNDNGPEQTKAITTLAAGVVMVLFALVVIDTLNIPEWIEGLTNEAQNTLGGG